MIQSTFSPTKVGLPVKGAWLLKKILNSLPAKKANLPVNESPSTISSIGYLFSGTYGDVVQCLPVLESLSKQYPATLIQIVMPVRLFESFKGFFPANVKRAKGREIILWIIKPRSLILTNTVGVFRVGFEWIGRFCGHRSLGYCYSEEKGRAGYSYCLQLTSDYRYIIHWNMLLLTKICVAKSFETTQEEAPLKSTSLLSDREDLSSKKKILFHIGSAGLQNDVGEKRYGTLISELIDYLTSQSYELTVITGPSEGGLIHYMENKHPKIILKSYALSDLKATVESFQGTLLCFNSFFAHFTYYLKQSAVVLHQNAIPRGYDCSPFHKQIILQDKENLSLKEVFQEFSG